MSNHRFLLKKKQEAPGADAGRFRFDALAARYRPESLSGEDLAWRDWSQVFRTWAGRFQRGRVQAVIRAAEARSGEEAAVTELDVKLEDWDSAELRGVAADFFHAVILVYKKSGAEGCLVQQRG